MPHKRPALWIGLVSVVVAVGIIVALVIRIPSTAQQLPPNTARISIVLSHPTDGSTWPADTPIPVAVMVSAGVPLKSVELWTDGRLFDTKIPEDDQIVLFKVWSWMPLTEGAHAIFARATDENGQTADSNAIHIQATAPVGLIVSQITEGGETLVSLAELNGVTPEDIADINPSIDPAGTISPGTQVFIPLQPFSLPAGGEPPNSPPPDGPVTPAEEGAPVGPAFFLEDALNLNSDNPGAPSLFASVGVCNVTLTIQDNSSDENGFFVYALPEASASFQRVASLKAHSSASLLQYTIPDQIGHIQFYVSSYNSAGESPSAPVAVNVSSPQCNPNQGSQGGLKYQGGFLTVPAGVDLAYFYSSMDGGVWERIPPGDEFLEPARRKIDLRAKIQQLLGGAPTGEADLDVWGWSEGALEHLGIIHINANFSSLAICNLTGGCGGDMGATHWVTEATVGSDKDQTTRPLRWTAHGSDITHAIWQVSTQPFPAEYSVGAPPGLLISGISNASINEKTGVATGDFSIDFNADLKFAGGENGDSQSSQRVGMLEDFGGFDPGLLPLISGGGINQLGLMTYNLWLPQKLYIRVTPIAGNHPASDPSNTVLVSYQPTGDPPPIKISKVPTYSVEIVPNSYVNEVQVVQKLGTIGCSEITGVDKEVFMSWYKQNYEAAKLNPLDPYNSQVSLETMAEDAYNFWFSRIGYIACPGIVEEDDPSLWEQFGEAFVNMWNTLSSTLEQIKGTLVGALASIIPGCEEECKSVLMTGLNFAITYFTGLPPSIPNFDDAVNMGIDYAIQMAISKAGIPYCDPSCQEKIKEEIKKAGSDVINSGISQPACSNQNYTLSAYEGTQHYSLKPLCYPPGVSVVPVKGSSYENGMVHVKVTRIDGSPEPAPMQVLSLNTQAVNPIFGDGHSSTEYYQATVQENCQMYQGQKMCASVTHTYPYDMIYSAPLEGIPYPPVSIPIPALKTGQSVVVPVVFQSQAYDNKPPYVYLPRAAAIQNAYPEADLNTIQVYWASDFTHLTDSSSQITIKARVICQDKELLILWNSPCSEIDTQEFIVP